MIHLSTGFFLNSIFLLAAPSAREPGAGAGQMAVWLGIAVAVIAIGATACWLLTRMAHRRRYNSQTTLFTGLCAVHGLARGPRGLLRQIAKHHGLRHPAQVFLEPQWLDPARLAGPFRAQAAEIRALSQKLIGEDPRGAADA